MPLEFYIVLALAFIFGAVIGSFLNVCIYRIPAGKSIVSPPSSCPNCGAGIRWYQNIPIFSWLLLGCKCAACKVPISPRYPLIEALNGILFVLVLWYFGFSWATPVYWLLVSMLVTITFIDLDHRIIPDVISLPGILVGFLTSFAIPWLSWLDSLIGILVGGGSLYLVALLYALIAKREGMGGGDIKLLAMLGAFLGWQAIFPVIFFASVVGTLVGVPLMLLQKGDAKLALPFGPFLASAALVYLFWGADLIDWYLGLFAATAG